MKNTISMCIFSFFLLILVIGCGDDNKDKPSGGGNDSSETIISSKDLIGVWRRQDTGKTNKGKEYLGEGKGHLGNFNSGTFSRATEFNWVLSGNVTEEIRIDKTNHEEIIELVSSVMQQKRKEDGKIRNWKKQGGDSTATNDPALLAGTWLKISENGVNILSPNFRLTLTDTTLTATGDLECNENGTYTTSGSSFTFTVTKVIPVNGGTLADCAPISEVVTVTYAVTETQLTITSVDEDTAEKTTEIFIRES